MKFPKWARPTRLVVILLCLVLAVFWFYAFFIARHSKANAIADKEWTQFAETTCQQAEIKRNKLADFTRIGDSPEELAKRADLVEQATDGLRSMLDTLETRSPNNEKGRAIVGLWIDEYRIHLDDRGEYVAELRNGKNVTFAETAVEGVPISERLLTFAQENLMDTCAPPTDVAG